MIEMLLQPTRLSVCSAATPGCWLSPQNRQTDRHRGAMGVCECKEVGI